MNNVKPQVGQKWDIYTPDINLGIVEIKSIDGDKAKLTNNMVVSVSGIRESCEFIPQNDLEWLAVNVDLWTWDRCGRLSRYLGGYAFSAVSDIKNSYTRRQWQNMRYYLGLDKKATR